MCITYCNIKMVNSVRREVDEVREESLEEVSAVDLEEREKLVKNDTQDY